ncbi:MAG: MerR family transcriptional regulator, partial [Cypionkella sp.]
ADLLETPAHVLRFWESRFPQIRPVKRAGGRRYYRPNDVALLTGIKFLLHAEGMTIRGAQKMLRDQGVRHVAGLGGAEIVGVDDDAEAALTAALSTNFGITPPKPERAEPQRAETATIVALETALRRSDARKTAPPPSSGAEVTALDRSASLENGSLGETPPLPGLDLADAAPDPAPAPDLPPPAAQDNAARHRLPLSLPDALRALPSAALAASPAARALLARARTLHARLLQKPNAAGI